MFLKCLKNNDQLAVRNWQSARDSNDLLTVNCKLQTAN